MEKANLQTIISDRLQLMQETQNGKTSSNNLYQHLCHLLTHLLLTNDLKNRKIDSLSELAAISQYIKKCTKRDKQAEPLSEDELNELITRRSKFAKWFTKKRQFLTFFQQAKQKNRKQSVLIQNFEKSHRNLFSKIGISFGEQQALRINIAMQKLKQKVNAEKIRFWGKILTKTSDYYVIQGIANKKFPQQISEGMEKYKEGVNYFSYWVNNLFNLVDNQWHELPLITPNQLRTSRFFKYIFTGNLHALIKNYPLFEGTQQHLLKAQLVRITHNCEIAPKGLYNPTEQNSDQIQFAQEFKMQEFVDLSNLENWVHVNPYILQLGRCSYWVDPKMPQQQKQEAIAKLNQADPKIQRLKAINQDKAVEGKGAETAWFVKTIGSAQLYNNIGKEQGTTSCYAIVVIKNINWPGWFSVGSTSGFDSIYIGSGIKITQAAFSPISPQNLLGQGEDIEEFSEPNPRNPPDELEPDSDDENKKVEQ